MLAALALVALLAPAPPQDPPAPKPAGSVSGRVLDALGEPVPLADVAFGLWDKPPLGKNKTDGTGMFAVAGLPLSATDYLIFSATAPGRTRELGYVRVTPASPADTVLLRLWDAGSVRGRAVDGEGKPVVGAVVSAAYEGARSGGFDPDSETVTDGEGRFVLDRVPLGYITVLGWAPGYVMQTRRTWLRDTTDVDLVLQRGAGVRLSVRIEGLPDGVDARCSVIPYADGGARRWPRVLRDVLGKEWQRTGLLRAEFVVRALADGFVFDPSEQRSKGDGPHELVFRASPRRADGLTVAGTLRDLKQKPLAKMTVALRLLGGGPEATAVTDADGRFSIVSQYARGTKAVLVLRRSSGYVLAQPFAGINAEWDKRQRVFHQLVVGAQESLDLIAQPAASVRGRLLDPEGEPVAFQDVDLEEHDGNRNPSWMSFSWQMKTDREGRFEFLGLRPPEGDLRVVAGGSGNVSEIFQLGVGATQTLEFTMQPLGSVGGVVLDTLGKPVAGARVWLRNCDESGRETDGSVLEVLTDRKGRFRHVGVDPGWHMLWLQRATGSSAIESAILSDPFEVKPGGHVERELQGDLGG